MNLPYTMTPEMVADVARAFRPRILYPYHYGDTDPQRLVELLRDQPDIEVRIRPMRRAGGKRRPRSTCSGIDRAYCSGMPNFDGNASTGGFHDRIRVTVWVNDDDKGSELVHCWAQAFDSGV